MSRRKVCVVVTARPSYSRVKSVLRALQAHCGLDLLVVASASALLDRYGNVVRVMEAEGFPITARVHTVLEGENPTTMAASTGVALLKLATVLENLAPDVVITVADRYETLATAIAASYMNLPLAHIQGGEVTGSIDEKVRHAVTKLADLHFVSTERAADRVIRMGEDPATVFVTGCPSIDLAAGILDRPELDFDPLEKYGGVGLDLDLASGYLVVVQHPVTTEYQLAREHVWETLLAVRDSGIPVLYFWPNVDAGSDGTSNGIRAFREIHDPLNIHFFKYMEPADFLRLLYNCRCLVGNSSVGLRECSFLGVPVVNVGTRQEGRERARNVVDVPYDREAIAEAIRNQAARGNCDRATLYGSGDAGERVAALLAEVPLRFEKKLYY